LDVVLLLLLLLLLYCCCWMRRADGREEKVLGSKARKWCRRQQFFSPLSEL
jgi:hypothetical protein